MYAYHCVLHNCHTQYEQFLKLTVALGFVCFRGFVLVLFASVELDLVSSVLRQQIG